MRQILSWRFIAAIVAVGVFALVVYILGSRQGGSGAAGADDADVRRMDFISLVASITADGFAMTANDTVSEDQRLMADALLEKFGGAEVREYLSGDYVLLYPKNLSYPGAASVGGGVGKPV